MQSCALLHSLPAWCAIVIAMIHALALLQFLWCNDVKLCNPAPDAIAVAFLTIWIVKANENWISHGNIIKLNVLLRELNYFLRCGKQRLPLAIPCEDMNAFVYMNMIPRCQSLTYYGTGIRVLFGWWPRFYSLKNTLKPNRVQGARFNLVGSFGIHVRGDPPCILLSLEGSSKATTHKPHRTCSM
jgi:hypothetical protein